MFENQIIGQKTLKEQLLKNVSNQQTPHAQLFVDENGYGGLPLALFQTLLLTYSESELTAKKQVKSNGFKLLEHPDIHFIYPVVKLGSKKKTYANDYIRDWYHFLKVNAYCSYSDWYTAINAENKQGIIAVHEIDALHKKIYLKSYSGGNKVCVIWGIDKMNTEACNKFLKLLEEPPKNTFFILVASDITYMLPTIISRCQITELKPIGDADLNGYLQSVEWNNVPTPTVDQASGSMRYLINYKNSEASQDFEKLFINCLRTAFQAQGNKAVVIDLMRWVDEISSLGREDQKTFILYAIGFLRNAFLLNYELSSMVHFESRNNFDIKKLAPFVHSQNFMALINLFEKAFVAVQRNVNGKMLFTDLALQITRQLHKKE